MQRIILHMDLDSFYAAVEEKRNPSISGKPIVICVFSGRSSDSGAVATANYKARELGIKAGIPIVLAKKLANEETVFLPNDINYYREVSERIMELIEDECDALEQASVDEAYMDVTQKSNGTWENAQAIAQAIKQKIKDQEGLTCSIGIGPNKLVAKMASKVKKPDGLTMIKTDEVENFLENLDVRKLHGVGGKTTDALSSLGIKTAKELAHFSPLALEEKLGKNKTRLLQEKARGIDESPVEQKEAQQISRIGTLKEDTRDQEVIFEKIKELAQDMKRKVEKKKVFFRTIGIIAIDTGLETQTRSETMAETDDINIALLSASQLLAKFLEENPKKRLRRVGIRISNLLYKKEQTSLGDFAQRYFTR